MSSVVSWSPSFSVLCSPGRPNACVVVTAVRRRNPGGRKAGGGRAQRPGAAALARRGDDAPGVQRSAVDLWLTPFGSSVVKATTPPMASEPQIAPCGPVSTSILADVAEVERAKVEAAFGLRGVVDAARRRSAPGSCPSVAPRIETPVSAAERRPGCVTTRPGAVERMSEAKMRLARLDVRIGDDVDVRRAGQRRRPATRSAVTMPPGRGGVVSCASGGARARQDGGGGGVGEVFQLRCSWRVRPFHRDRSRQKRGSLRAQRRSIAAATEGLRGKPPRAWSLDPDPRTSDLDGRSPDLRVVGVRVLAFPALIEPQWRHAIPDAKRTRPSPPQLRAQRGFGATPHRIPSWLPGFRGGTVHASAQ